LEDSDEDTYVTIQIAAKQLRIFGSKTSQHGNEKTVRAWHQETVKARHQGQSVIFSIDPRQLLEIIRRYGCHCTIGQDRLCAGAGRVSYVAMVAKEHS
jgi:hypothetical protein